MFCYFLFNFIRNDFLEYSRIIKRTDRFHFQRLSNVSTFYDPISVGSSRCSSQRSSNLNQVSTSFESVTFNVRIYYTIYVCNFKLNEYNKEPMLVILWGKFYFKISSVFNILFRGNNDEIIINLFAKNIKIVFINTE